MNPDPDPFVGRACAVLATIVLALILAGVIKA